MPNLTTKQKIAIALSVPVAGILFYVLLKWVREDEEFSNETNVDDTEFVSSTDLVSEMTVQQCHVGAIIGRGGSVIKQIQKESETRINFKDDEDESEDELTEEAKPKVRTILIRGSQERIKHAEVMIRRIIEEQPVLEKVSIEIPQQVIGRIIGKSGKTIRQLCRVSGAKIKINSDNDTSDIQRCDITGTQSQIEYAKQLINEKIVEEKEFRTKRQDSRQAKNKLTFAHLPVHSDYFTVYVSAIDTPGHFWIQSITTDSELLDKLIEEMTQFYGDRGEGHRLTSPKVGDLCSAPFKHDESWYRGEIVKVIEDSGDICIHYLDFGDVGVVSKTNVKQLRKEFCGLPFQAVEVYLANIKPKGGKWSKEACDVFEKLSYCAQWKVLMAKLLFYDDNGVPCIELFDTNTENDVNIEQKLVEQNFAEYKEEISNTENIDKKSHQEITLEQINEEFQSAAFEDDSFELDELENFEFSIPKTSGSDMTLVNEPSIDAEKQNVVHCADISELENLFGMLNVDSTDAAETDEISQNLIEPASLHEKDDDSELKTEEQSHDSSADEETQGNEENLIDRNEDIEEKIINNLDETDSSTCSVNVQENFTEPITVSSQYVLFETTKDDPNIHNSMYFPNEQPVTSTPEYHLKQSIEEDSRETLNNTEDYDPPDSVQVTLDYGLRRSYSEDLRTVDSLTDGALTKSSSEITVSPSKDDELSKMDNKKQNLSSVQPKVGKRVLAANFGQRFNNFKPVSDEEKDDDDDDDVSEDGSSLYLSAREDSDSTGFFSATGSRSNLRFNDTDSDVTPSGYLSEPEDNSIEIPGDLNLDDQSSLDTTLLVEKLEHYTNQ